MRPHGRSTCTAGLPRHEFISWMGATMNVLTALQKADLPNHPSIQPAIPDAYPDGAMTMAVPRSDRIRVNYGSRAASPVEDRSIIFSMASRWKL